MPNDPFLEAANVIDMFLRKAGGFRTIVYGRRWKTKPAALFAISLKSLVFLDTTTVILNKVDDGCIPCDKLDRILRCIFITELMTGNDIPDKKRRLQQQTRKNLAYIRSLKCKIMREIEELRSIYDPIDTILPSSLYNALHPIKIPKFVRINIPYVLKLYGNSKSPKHIIEDLLSGLKVKQVKFPALDQLDTYSFDPLIEDVLCFDYKFDTFHNNLIKDNVLITQSRASCLPTKCIQDLLIKYNLSNPFVLDACAAPGSKTLHLASLRSKMTITANDRDPKRVKILKKRLIDCHILGNPSANKVNVVCNNFIDANEKALKGKYDIILTDVSCSGSGSTELDMCLTSIHYKTEEDNDIRLKSIIDNQKAVLRKALILSKRFVVYSTCSDDIREDEEVINDALISINKDKMIWEVIEAFPQWPERGINNDRYVFDASKCIRSSNSQFTDGFFVCILSRLPE